ncbi:MAG: alpha/beta fold hydrolase [Erythrobacter sp.]
MVWAFRILVGFAAFYIAILVALWALQTHLLYPASQAKPTAPDQFTDIELVAADGTKTRAIYREAKPGMPTVIFWHGNGDSLHGSMAANRYLERAGYGLMLPEFRGYGGNEGTPSEEGFYADGRAALEFLKERRIGPSETIISGYSIGSGTAVQMATEHQPAALLLNAPFRSLPQLVSEKFPWLPVRLLLRDRYENEAKVPDLTMPIFITHGSIDTLIPPSHGRALSDAASNAEFVLLKGLGHNEMTRDVVVGTQLDWLEKQGFGASDVRPQP